MIFVKKLFIYLFVGLFSFIAFQIVFRTLLGKEMIYFSDILQYFESISINNFDFGKSIANFVNDPTISGFLNMLRSIFQDALVVVNFIFDFFGFLFS